MNPFHYPEGSRRKGLAALLWLFAILSPAAQETPLRQPSSLNRSEAAPNGPEKRLFPYGGATLDEIACYGNPFTRKEFSKLFNSVYSNEAAAARWFRLTDSGLVYEGKLIPWLTPPSGKPLWRPVRLLPPMQNPLKPLEDVRIAIDPGHIGGSWASWEARDNTISGKYRIQEGVSTRIVARLLAERLRQLGATVLLTREASQPVTTLKLEDVLVPLTEQNKTTPANQLTRQAKSLLTGAAEINARAEKIKKFRADISLCLHFDAPGEVPYKDQLHLIINGACMPGEWENPDIRLSLLGKILSKTYEEEVAVSSAVAKSMASRLKLPAFQYSVPQERVRAVPGEPYLWCRNLLANSHYTSPVIYPEPFNMNEELTARRLTFGDYEGTVVFNKKGYPSIYREYADAVAEGLKQYYLTNRTPATKSPADTPSLPASSPEPRE